MKNIFDAIRAIFAHQPRDYSYESPFLGELYDFQKSIRGFSNHIATLTSPAPTLSDELKGLNRNLNNALFRLISALSRPRFASELESTPALSLPDTTGRLKALTLSRAAEIVRYDAHLTLRMANVSLDGHKLTIRWTLTPAGSPLFREREAYVHEDILENVSLDTIKGAASALRRIQELRERIMADGGAHPAYIAALNNLQEAQKKDADRTARLTACFSQLSPSDRQYAQSLISTTSPMYRLFD